MEKGTSLYSQYGSGDFMQKGVWTEAYVECETKGLIFSGTVNMYGPGFMIEQGSLINTNSVVQPLMFELSCPLVSRKHLEKRLNSGRSFGVSGPLAAAALMGGVHLGVGVNLRGAICSIAGLPQGIGAMFGVAKFDFNRLGK